MSSFENEMAASLRKNQEMLNAQLRSLNQDTKQIVEASKESYKALEGFSAQLKAIIGQDTFINTAAKEAPQKGLPLLKRIFKS